MTRVYWKIEFQFLIMGFCLLPLQHIHFRLCRMSYISIFYVSLVIVRVQFDILQYILSQTKVTRSDPKKSLHLLEMPNVLLWASKNEYFITCYYYGRNFDSGCLSIRWKYVIHSRFSITQLQWGLHDYLDQYLKICLCNRKACFIFAS